MNRGILAETPTQDTRLAIIEAAVRIFARSGVLAATLEDIANEAGVTRGALCWHFHSKDELVSAIIKHYSPHSMICPVIDQIEQDLQNGVQLDDETIFRRLARAFYDAFTAQGDFARLAILIVYSYPQAARVLSDMVVKGRKRITEYVRKRQEEGYFCKHIEPGLLVQAIAAIFAMRAVGRGLEELLPYGHLSREEFINQLVSLLCIHSGCKRISMIFRCRCTPLHDRRTNFALPGITAVAKSIDLYGRRSTWPTKKCYKGSTLLRTAVSSNSLPMIQEK